MGGWCDGYFVETYTFRSFCLYCHCEAEIREESWRGVRSLPWHSRIWIERVGESGLARSVTASAQSVSMMAYLRLRGGFRWVPAVSAVEVAEYEKNICMCNKNCRSEREGFPPRKLIRNKNFSSMGVILTKTGSVLSWYCKSSARVSTLRWYL